MNLVFICLGQGAQYYGMGRSLLEQEPIFQQKMQQGSDYLESLIHRNLLDECVKQQSTSKPLDDIMLSHPGLVIMQVALAQTLEHYHISRPWFGAVALVNWLVP